MVMPTRRERVLPRLIEDEMRESFLDYSMSVIVQRALPDVRDGLKPVHRRILYAMHDAGLIASRPYKKSATVVGDVLGKYHPHGDTAVYDALVRMVQDFSLRYPLIDGQGNFGSIDGDNAAAYRYTEARLTRLAGELLADIEKGTVDFIPNFDDQREEPQVLPSKFPNLLVNGSSGIAVGMATNIPPHNLREIGRAMRHLLDHPDCTVDDLMKYVPGPDFPTGAYILGRQGIRDAYETGRGRMVMRAAVHKEALRGAKEQLVVTGLPYGVSKVRVIEQIAGLAKGGKLPDAADLRDESDRDGMRIVIELKRGARVPAILSLLYKQTHLQATFGAIMLALDHGVPRELSLRALLERFRDHRLDVIRRRSTYDRDAAKAREHIVEGLLTALDDIDEVIEIIRSSKNQDAAAEKLKSSFDLDDAQAKAILAMRLGTLTALETSELRDERKVLRKQIRELDAILKSEKRQRDVLVEELEGVVKAYGDDRRTVILDETESFEVEDLEAEEQVVISLSHGGYIKRVPMALYRRRVARGKAQAGMDRFENDFLEHVFVAGSADTLLFFSDRGDAYALAVHDVPETGPASRGRALAQVLTMEKGARVAALVPVSEFVNERSLLFLTRTGSIKRTSLDEYAKIRAGGLAAIKLQKDDRVLDVQLLEAGTDIVIVTRQGRAIRFPESEVSAMGRLTQGVRGIQLRKGDGVIGMVVVRRDATLCTVTAEGYAKRTLLSEYPAQKRGGLGTITLDVTDKTGPLIAVKEVLDGDELMVIAANGEASRIKAPDIPIQGRATQGKRVISLEEGNRVVEVARVAEERKDETGPDGDPTADDGNGSSGDAGRDDENGSNGSAGRDDETGSNGSAGSADDDNEGNGAGDRAGNRRPRGGVKGSQLDLMDD